jgi:phospholipid-binding lipoprotein MlaA
MSGFKAIAAVLVLLPVLAGCASQPATSNPEENDPFESFNRQVFQGSVAADKAVLKPVALTYRAVVPSPVRDSVRNFMNNLNTPVVFTNDLLQGEFDRAKTTFVRAGINTTAGIGGLFDVATLWGYQRHSEDFGQTLAVWGVGEGPYLFLPFIGPANPRDLAGFGVDFLFDPLTWIQWDGKFYWTTGRAGLDFIDFRERNIETLDEVEKGSLDYYASVRSLYRQTRQNEIRNGATEVQDLPDF